MRLSFVIITGVALAGALGCGRLGFDANAVDTQVDAGIDTGTLDAAPGPMEFSEGVVVVELVEPNSSSDDATLTGDLLEVMFESSRSGGGDIYRSTRNSVAEAWGAPTLVNALSSPSNESTLAISSNGLFVLFFSTRDDPNGDLYLATRSSRTEEFGPPTRVTELNSDAADAASWIRSDGLEVLIHSTRPNGAGSDDFNVYRSVRSDLSTPFSTPQLVPGLASPEHEISATLHDDGDMVLFSVIDPATRTYDMHIARRAPGPDFAFEASTPLQGAVNMPGVNESDAWLAPDQCTLFFTREAASSNSIYMSNCVTPSLLGD